MKRTSTRDVYRNAIDRWCKTKDSNGSEVGTLSAATLRRDHVVAMMEAKRARQESANLVRKVLRAMMRHAIEIGMRTDDPTRDVKLIKVKTDGFHSWSDDEIAQYEARHPIGSKARLALALLLYTGQRRSDVVRMGKQHINKDGEIHVRQDKTDAELVIPVHSALQAIRRHAKRTPNLYRHPIWKPFTSAGFGGWFRDDATRPDEALRCARPTQGSGAALGRGRLHPA